MYAASFGCDHTTNALVVAPSGGVMSPEPPGRIAHTGRVASPGYPADTYSNPFAANGVGVELLPRPRRCHNGLPSTSNDRTSLPASTTISVRCPFCHTKGVAQVGCPFGSTSPSTRQIC